MTLSKTVGHLKGIQDESKWPHLRRRNHVRSMSSEVSTNLKVEGLCPDLSAGVASIEVGRNVRVRQSNLLKWLELRIEKFN
jgi:hypothetical protein